MSNSKLEPLLVVGHQNPDTDAICSAIAYASYLTETGNAEVEAICCGDIPERTQWVLDQAKLPAPRLVLDVRATAGDLVGNEDFWVNERDTILSAYRTMLQVNMKSIPVIDDKKSVVGILKFVDLLPLMMPSQTQGISVKTIYTSFKNALETLGGKSVGVEIANTDEEEELVLFVTGSSEETVEKRIKEGAKNGKKIVAICGDRPSVHKLLLSEGIHALVISGGFEIEANLIDLAKDNGVAVIYSSHDTATTVQLMRCSRCVESAVSEEFICVQENEAISGFKDRLTASSQDVFPVIASGSLLLLGSFLKSDLIDPPQKNLVLVDHNEYAQAVKGVEEAKVVEVLDHHRLAGDIVTREPIAYLNEPVGSTCTLVARKYLYTELKPTRGVALCLCAGLISDTLNLTSPTTTDLDKRMLEWLCKIADIDAAEFTKGFFEAGSLLLHGSPAEIVGVDRKEFKEGGAFISISQIEELVVDSLPSRVEEIREELQKLVDTKGYDIAIIAVTDISKHTSIVLSAGCNKIGTAIPYEQSETGIWQAPGVVSRKKQIFPAMCEAIYNSTSTEIEGT